MLHAQHSSRIRADWILAQVKELTHWASNSLFPTIQHCPDLVTSQLHMVQPRSKPIQAQFSKSSPELSIYQCSSSVIVQPKMEPKPVLLYKVQPRTESTWVHLSTIQPNLASNTLFPTIQLSPNLSNSSVAYGLAIMSHDLSQYQPSFRDSSPEMVIYQHSSTVIVQSNMEPKPA